MKIITESPARRVGELFEREISYQQVGSKLRREIFRHWTESALNREIADRVAELRKGNRHG
jgi:hypothetical protein